jgi:adenylate cyclase
MPEGSQDVSKEAVLAELNAVVAGPALARAPQLQAMLRYLVTETLAGRGPQIKAFNIAVDVFGRGPDFDAAQDTIVRVQAGRLRTALAQHYTGEGRSSPLRIELGKGSYVPRFVPASATAPPPADPPDGGIGQPLGAAAGPTAAPEPVTAIPGGRYGLLILFAVLLGLSLALAFSWRAPSPPATATLEPARPPAVLKTTRLAVAPFSDLSAAGDQQALADALTAEVTSSLARPGLIDLTLISARGVGMGEDLRLAAEKLGARWALTGVLHRTGTRVRTNIFLMDVSNGGLVWSQDYERDSTDLVPDALTDAILLDLRPQLYWSAKRVLETKPDPTAHELFVLSTWSPGLETNTLAWQHDRIELARRAITSDPSLGPAHSVLADKL